MSLQSSSYDYIEITDPDFVSTCEERNESDYILVKPKDYSKVPVKIPNWDPKPCCLTKRYVTLDEKVKTMSVRSDDVWVISFPKNGTTWAQAMVWLIANDLNYEKANDIHISNRFPFLEIGGLLELPPGRDPYQRILNMAPPRYIKSHLPVAFLPDDIWTAKPKIIYVKRNPKDVIVSYFHHWKNFIQYTGSLADYADEFIKDLSQYSPYIDHIIEYTKLDYPNILHLCFEDMKMDLRGAVVKVCDFLGKDYSDAEIEKLCNHLKFENMKENYSAHYDSPERKSDDPNTRFMRKGQVGDWKNEMSKATADKVDQWIQKSVKDPELLKLFV